MYRAVLGHMCTRAFVIHTSANIVYANVCVYSINSFIYCYYQRQSITRQERDVSIFISFFRFQFCLHFVAVCVCVRELKCLCARHCNQFWRKFVSRITLSTSLIFISCLTSSPCDLQTKSINEIITQCCCHRRAPKWRAETHQNEQQIKNREIGQSTVTRTDENNIVSFWFLSRVSQSAYFFSPLSFCRLIYIYEWITSLERRGENGFFVFALSRQWANAFTYLAITPTAITFFEYIQFNCFLTPVRKLIPYFFFLLNK